MKNRIYLPKVEFITVGIFEGREDKAFKAGERYPAIILSYSDKITTALLRMMMELNVSEKDLFMVNFEKLEGKSNVIVCFKIKRNGMEIMLVAETEINDKSVSCFKKYFERTKSFIVSFGLYREDDVISLDDAWHVVCYSLTEYDGNSALRYLCGQYE